jgi:hypothetical protein
MAGSSRGGKDDPAGLEHFAEKCRTHRTPAGRHGRPFAERLAWHSPVQHLDGDGAAMYGHACTRPGACADPCDRNAIDPGSDVTWGTHAVSYLGPLVSQPSLWRCSTARRRMRSLTSGDEFRRVGERYAPPILIKTGRMLNYSPVEMAWHILIPAALPEIFTGIRVGFALTLIGTLLGEMFASQRGLGNVLMRAIGLHNVDLIMAITFMLTAVTAVASGLLLLIDAKLRRRAAVAD